MFVEILILAFVALVFGLFGRTLAQILNINSKFVAIVIGATVLIAGIYFIGEFLGLDKIDHNSKYWMRKLGAACIASYIGYMSKFPEETPST